MALTGNPLLKLLVVPVVIGAILIGVSMMGKKESAQSQGAATPTVTSEEAATLGIDGDTPADTLRTIVAESRQLKDQISKVIQENDSLKAANENLQGRLRNIDQNIEQKLNNTAQELQQQQENRSQTILDQVQKRLENLTHIPEAGDTDLPVGFGVRPEDGQHFQGAGSSSSDIVWIEPQ
ncbi:TIGR03752 family integrating conjugative element protein, partial [Pseudomonas aeruginosa]|nr:TIGR03752 family integrating conjugative element protein [Pseudomonas aeruginosa]